jgi:hypothetical protein
LNAAGVSVEVAHRQAVYGIAENGRGNVIRTVEISGEVIDQASFGGIQFRLTHSFGG